MFRRILIATILCCWSCDDETPQDDAGVDGDADGDVDGDVDGDGDVDVDGDADGDESDAEAPELWLSLSVNPNPHSVLSAVIAAETARPCELTVEITEEDGGGRVVGRTPNGTLHSLTILGLYPESSYRLTPYCWEEDTGHSRETLEFETGSLPSGIPSSFDVEMHEPGYFAGGITFFGPRPRGTDSELEACYVAVDGEGEVVWYYELGLPAEDTAHADLHHRVLGDGNYLLSIPDGLRVITPAGELVSELTADIVGAADMHHDGIVLPDGRFLFLTRERRELVVPPFGRIEVVGDMIWEAEPSGEVTWQWSSFDHLDTTRFPGELSQRADREGRHDWTHSNAIVYLEEDRSILLSTRNQSWVVKIGRETGEVLWILGNGGDFTLTNLDREVWNTWFFSQHAPEVQPDGSILIYDNGNERLPAEAPRFSRGILYSLDEAAREAAVTWQWRTPNYTGFLGDADMLENGNVLLTAGGQNDDEVPAQILEVSGGEEPELVWQLDSTAHQIYRATRLMNPFGDE